MEGGQQAYIPGSDSRLEAQGSRLERDQPGQHVGFFSGRAFTAHHVVAIAAKPFFGFGRVGESLGVEGRRQGTNHLSRAGVLACAEKPSKSGASNTPLKARVRREKGLRNMTPPEVLGKWSS